MGDRVPEPGSWESVLRWTAWVVNGADAAMVSDALQRVLADSRLTAVRYADLDYGVPVPYWHEGDRDTLGHGIELDFADGSTRSIIWEQQGAQGGLGVWRGPLMPDHLREARIWDVTRRWHRHGPRTITDVQAFWYPEQPAWEGGPTASLSLGGLILHDGDRGRLAVIAIGHSFDVNVYFSAASARRDGCLTENYISFGAEPLRAGGGATSDR